MTASFSHVSADADFPFVCASAFGGGESSLRLRKSPWHQSDISRFAVKLTMTEVKSNEIGPTQAANNTARIIYTTSISEGLHFPSTCFWEKKVEIIGRTWNAPQIKSFNHESTLLAQRNAKQWLVHSYLFSTAKSNPEWKHIETTSSKHLVCKHNPVELLAAISSLAETYSITVTASFSHVSADADFPFICASPFGGGESSLRLRKSPWQPE